MNHNLQLPEPPLRADEIPNNVVLGQGTVVSGRQSFLRFRSKCMPGVISGAQCTFDAVHFAVGPAGRIRTGDFCFLTSAILLCELELVIGNYVSIGWNATIADSDFHPLSPAQRVADAVALSPLGKEGRPPMVARRVQIDDDVWIGPSAVVLKGVWIGAGAVIEPGSVVTRDVPAGARVAGNPARTAEQP